MENSSDFSQDQSVSQNHEKNNEIVPRVPVLAVLLGIVLPGGGQIYAGYLERGLIFSLIEWAIFSICVFSFNAGTSFVFLTFCGLIIFTIFILYDAYKLAKNQQSDYKLKWYNRWYIYIAGILIHALINQVFQLSIDSILNK